MLEKIISNLKKKSVVDAVFVTGSQGIREQKQHSDIDLVVIVNGDIDLSDVTQWIDGKQCDVKLFSESYIQSILDKETISPNDPEGLIVSFLEKADIQFDKTGFVTAIVKDFARIQKKLEVPERKKKWFERVINHAYFTNKRYFESNLPEYHESLQIKLLASLDLLLKGYFEFRNIPWRGEKQVMKYLKTHDPEFASLYMSCVETSIIATKFILYSKLVERVFTDGYGIWDTTGIYTQSKNSLNTAGEEKMLAYWKNLVS